MTFTIETFATPSAVGRALEGKRVDDYSFTVCHEKDKAVILTGSGYLIEKDALHAACTALRRLA